MVHIQFSEFEKSEISTFNRLNLKERLQNTGKFKSFKKQK